ncbi:AMP-activated serine/threonine-protein kinase regulatory subunit [Borealophlyctis nickersoniae]|nr:AMP-activated serine/threonine-protein kinase regulatory subunit [Borealophlyctis nickersoniae]
MEDPTAQDDSTPTTGEAEHYDDVWLSTYPTSETHPASLKSPLLTVLPVADKLKRTSCYDLLPVSYKIIIFDTSLLVKKALAALLQHGVQSAPLWDSNAQRFAGMLTVTDFIHLILYYYNHSSYDAAIEEIEQLQISTLRASRLLIDNHLHRLPLVDRVDGHEMIISVVTQYKILKFIAANCPELTQRDSSLRDLGIGTYQDIATAKVSTPLIIVLNKFIQKKISAMPIVDDNGNVLDVYEKYDVLMLAREGAYYDLEMPVSEALIRRSPDFEGIHACSETDTLGHILETIRSMPVHRFIVVGEDKRLKGVVSLSDLLDYLITH